jgi:hypothetical protein
LILGSNAGRAIRRGARGGRRPVLASGCGGRDVPRGLTTERRNDGQSVQPPPVDTSGLFKALFALGDTRTLALHAAALTDGVEIRARRGYQAA